MNKDEAQIARFHELFEYKDGCLYWKKHRKNWVKVGQAAGLKTPKRYVDVRVDSKMMRAHRIIFAMHNGYFPEMVDHINGIKTDNRIENLRACTRSQNAQNKTKTKETRNTFVKDGRYGVALMVNKKQIHIGYFDSQEEANVAAKKARKEHFGEFA